jgi:hypothetical protein
MFNTPRDEADVWGQLAADNEEMDELHVSAVAPGTDGKKFFKN